MAWGDKHRWRADDLEKKAQRLIRDAETLEGQAAQLERSAATIEQQAARARAQIQAAADSARSRRIVGAADAFAAAVGGNAASAGEEEPPVHEEPLDELPGCDESSAQRHELVREYLSDESTDNQEAGTEDIHEDCEEEPPEHIQDVGVGAVTGVETVRENEKDRPSSDREAATENAIAQLNLDRSWMQKWIDEHPEAWDAIPPMPTWRDIIDWEESAVPAQRSVNCPSLVASMEAKHARELELVVRAGRQDRLAPPARVPPTRERNRSFWRMLWETFTN